MDMREPNLLYLQSFLAKKGTTFGAMSDHNQYVSDYIKHVAKNEGLIYDRLDSILYSCLLKEMCVTTIQAISWQFSPSALSFSYSRGHLICRSGFGGFRD